MYKLYEIPINLKGISGVYLIRNTENNKIYIGSSKNLYVRLQQHFNQLLKKTHINPHLQNAYNLFTKEKFIIEIIELCDNMLDREQYWLDYYKSYDREIGYNNTNKVNSSSGYKHTDLAKEKMRLSKLGTKQSAETVLKRANKLRGQKRTYEQKLAASKCKLGEKNGMFGKKEDEKHKKHRMKNMLAKPRWNTGLTKDTDKRLEKLAVWKDKLPPNAIKCSLVDTQTNEKWVADSLKGLSEICPISLPSIHRLKNSIAGKKITERYRYYEG